MGEKNYHTTKYAREEEQLLNSFPKQDRAYIMRLLHEVSNLKVGNVKPHETAWKYVDKQLPKAKSVHFDSLKRIAMGVAASLVLVIASIAVLLSGNIEQTTLNAEHRVVYLPDGSEVILNAKSHLSYNQYLWKVQRSVRLEGEAFFQVQKGERFDVISKDKVVSVLGTSFNVLAREDQYQVACFTGKVKVVAKEQKVILTPNLSTSLKGGELSIPMTFDEKIGSWKRGDFYFENTTLRKVFETIQRQFGVKITTHELQRYYTGYFDISNLDQALKLVCEPMGLTYKVEGKKITIINKNNQ